MSHEYDENLTPEDHLALDDYFPMDGSGSRMVTNYGMAKLLREVNRLNARVQDLEAKVSFGNFFIDKTQPPMEE